MNKDIAQYNKTVESAEYRAVCELLAKEINANLQNATSKVWHAHPVWFIKDNPIVGFSIRKKGVSLMFWSGQAFKTPGLQAEGSFKAAEIFYQTVDDVDAGRLRKWLAESAKLMYDYKDIRKNKGKLSLIDTSTL